MDHPGKLRLICGIVAVVFLVLYVLRRRKCLSRFDRAVAFGHELGHKRSDRAGRRGTLVLAVDRGFGQHGKDVGFRSRKLKFQHPFTRNRVTIKLCWRELPTLRRLQR